MALETTPSRIVYFGDSLSDHGAIHDVTSRVLTVPVPPASAGYAGWFSNGEVQSGVTPELLGASADYYAVGGGRALGVRTIQDVIDENLAGQTPPFDPVLPDAAPEDLAFDTNLGGQVGRFLADTAADGPVPGTAAAFFIGFNDYANFQPSSPATARGRGAPPWSRRCSAQTIGAAATVGDGRRRHHPALQPARAVVLPLGVVPDPRAARAGRCGDRRPQRRARAGRGAAARGRARGRDGRHAPHRRRARRRSLGLRPAARR